MRQLWPGPVAISATIFVLDQASKWALERTLNYGAHRVLIPGLLDLVHVRNTGAAWGMFANNPLPLGFLSLAVLVGLALYFHKLSGGHRHLIWAQSLLMGGIAGNLVDRFWRQGVVDFVSFYVEFGGVRREWPAFNIADSAICVGVGIFFVSAWIVRPAAKAANPPAKS